MKPEDMNVGTWFDHGRRTADDTARAVIHAAEDFGWRGVEEEYRELVDGEGWTDYDSFDGEILREIEQEAIDYLNELVEMTDADTLNHLDYFGITEEDVPHRFDVSRFAGNSVCRDCGLLPLAEEDAKTVCLARLTWWLGHDGDRGGFGLWLDIIDE